MRKVVNEYLGNPSASIRRRVKASQAQERRVGEAGGGRRVRGSGAKPHARGDALWADHGVMLEAKRTEKASIRIEASWLEKITLEALANGMEPGLAFEIETCTAERDWVALPMSVVLRLLEGQA